MRVRILGIDPGIAIVGFGLIEADRGQTRLLNYGAITTPAELPLARRLVQIEQDMGELIAQLKPDAIAVEELFFSNNITTGIAVAQARGVTLLTCVKKCPALYEYTPMQIKQAVTGYGKADKKQMQEVVAALLRLKSIPRPDDAADALAVALCHGFTNRFGELFSVGNSTRTKGKNTVSGSYFRSSLEKRAAAGAKKTSPENTSFGAKI